jgi:hypothetical protein
MVPRSQLIYRYLQMAISMVMDLHLDADPSIIVRQPDFGANETGLRLGQDESLNRSREAFRAVLGCFYMSSV